MSNPEEASPDTFIEEEVERALQRFSGAIPDAEYAAFREILRWHLATEPVAARLMRSLRSPTIVAKSAEVDTGTGEPVELSPPAKGRERA